MSIIERAAVTSSADMAIGLVVNQYMFEVGATRQQLANALRISQPAVSKKLRGQSGWGADDVALTSMWLGLSVEDLMPSPHITADGDRIWIPASYKPGYAKSPDSFESRDSGLVARAGFEPTTSGL